MKNKIVKQLKYGEIVIWSCGHIAPVPKRRDNISENKINHTYCDDCCYYMSMAIQYQKTGKRL